MAEPGAGPRERFEEIYQANYAALARYALRRTQSSDDAVDVIAETFLAAWRRLDDVPDGNETRLWLYGTARRVLANHHRGQERREQLAARLRQEFNRAFMEEPEQPEQAREIHVAFERLSDGERELLSLSGWEGLSPAQIAGVLGGRAATVRVRLHRARKRFAKELAREGVDVANYGSRAVAMAEGVA